MILGCLGLGAPTNPLPATAWNAWTRGYTWTNSGGLSYIPFPPLFGHQYSHCWIDFRHIADAYMRSHNSTYFENSRRATLAQRSYCIANPLKHKGYSGMVWGLTACDGPPGYSAHGAPPPQEDDGTIAPTAAGGSIPFTPEFSVPTLRYFYDKFRPSLWTAYGFRDAFNLGAHWAGPDELGIDQGPMVIMIENYRTQRVWRRFMQNEVVQRGLQRAGFLPAEITFARSESDLSKGVASGGSASLGEHSPESAIWLELPGSDFSVSGADSLSSDESRSRVANRIEAAAIAGPGAGESKPK
jgi:hypothetical protein